MNLPTKDTDKYINRPFNIRPFCFWAFFVLLTVMVCLWSRGIGIWVVAVYFVLIISMFVILQHLRTRDAVLKFLGTSHIFFVVTLGLCIAVAAVFSLTTLSYTNQRDFMGTAEITGTVESYRIRDDGSGYVLLSAAEFSGERVSGYVQIYFENMSEEQTQHFVTTCRIVVTTRLNAAGASDYNINNRIKYTANLRGGEVTPLGEDMQLRHVIARYSKDFLGRVLEGENLELMYSMLFGDRSKLDGEINENFSSTGLAHILAVSGMHVGLIVGLLMVVLKLCRLDRKKQFIIIFIVLLFYCYLCGFRYSIMRASIMFLVFLANRIFLRSSDFLSSICAAGVLILIMFPYSLLSVSFQFSFACVLGIAFFQKPVGDFVGRFIKRPKFLADGITLYFCTAVMWLPLTIQYFGYVPTLGLFANILFLPILLFCFQICVVTLATFLTYPLLYIASLLLSSVLPIIHWLGNLSFSRIYIQGSGYFFLLYFVGLIFLTRFIFMRPRYKYPIAAVLMGVYVLSLLL